jgi:hypothetical protein
MQKSSIYIMLYGAALGCISILYFFSLVLHLPYIVCLAAVAAALFFITRWFNTVRSEEEADSNNIPLYVLIAGIIILTNETSYTATKYGAWDAWSIWDLHARYLANPEHWQHMFLNKAHTHPDYPLALPASLAFFYRPVSQELQYMIAFVFHYIIMLCIPVLIFLQTYKRGVVLPAIALLYFASSNFYAIQGTYFLADTLVAFFFLAAVVAIDHYAEDKKMIAIAAMMMGCCCWTKNEGIILCLLFLAFYYKPLFMKQHLKYTIAGLLLPLIALAVFKIVYAPANDIITTENTGIAAKLVDIGRYKTIWEAFGNSVTHYFYWPACAVGLCVLVALAKKKSPPKVLLLALSCCLAYLLVYVITPLDLDWHLHTSIDRLLHQLMPVSMYAVLVYFNGGSIFRWQAKFASTRSSPR